MTDNKNQTNRSDADQTLDQAANPEEHVHRSQGTLTAVLFLAEELW